MEIRKESVLKYITLVCNLMPYFCKDLFDKMSLLKTENVLQQ